MECVNAGISYAWHSLARLSFFHSFILSLYLLGISGYSAVRGGGLYKHERPWVFRTMRDVPLYEHTRAVDTMHIFAGQGAIHPFPDDHLKQGGLGLSATEAMSYRACEQCFASRPPSLRAQFACWRRAPQMAGGWSRKEEAGRRRGGSRLLMRDARLSASAGTAGFTRRRWVRTVSALRQFASLPLTNHNARIASRLTTICRYATSSSLTAPRLQAETQSSYPPRGVAR